MDSEIRVWVRWEEKIVSREGGRRKKVNFYVRDEEGRRDLAVVGREKSARHMVYSVPAKFFQSLIRFSKKSAADALPSDLKLRSRRQVVDWLSLLFQDSNACGLAPVLNRYSDDEDASPASIPISKVLSSERMRHYSEEFSWLDSSWDCRKRRKHYQSFCRNGITISVHDFIYVMAEGKKRLVAHIEDLYEDVKANNMVSVRWFHKVNELNIVLPADTNDREIFSSLCLQDFSVECIDGLASVLGFEDFDKFHKEAQHKYTSWDPYLCRRRIENDQVKPFDITQVQGYWSQDLLRSMYPSCIKLRLKIKGHGETRVVNDIEKSKGLSVGNRLGRQDQVKSGLMKKQNLIVPGLGIELLSQDSGIRGCWFYCAVLKRRRNKIKVQYRDVEDADGTGNLEEWVSASSIAAPDKLGIRMCGRSIVRPSPPKKDESLCSYEVGKVVDARWHDGWWEGIVIRNDSQGKVHVYFPGEQQVSIFSPADLRLSQDWVENKWNSIKARPDIATLLLLELDHVKRNEPSTVPAEPECLQEKGECSPPSKRPPQLVRKPLLEKKENNVPDLVKSFIHDDLKWSSSRKRTFGRQIEKKFLSSKRLRIDFSHKSSRQLKAEDIGNSKPFLIPKSLKVDQENCKIGGDSLFGAPMTLCSNLVMT